MAKRNYPRGRISADDEGETQVAIALDPETNTLILNLGKPTQWLGLGPAEVEGLLILLAKHLSTMKGVPVSIQLGTGHLNDEVTR